jgi:hypothetical protein
MFPIARFDLIDDDLADCKLVEWGHWLGGCNRPFGRESFGLYVEEQLLAVAVASTVNATCGGVPRQECVELARLCAHPDHRDMTRVALRLWRKVAGPCWARRYWPVKALVSYANAIRHKGDIYRFDGWTKVADVRGSVGGGNWTRKKVTEPKSVWVYQLGRPA